MISHGSGSGWFDGARAAGFTSRNGGEKLHRLGMTLESAGGWATLSHPAPGTEQMGLPGLWRNFAEGRAEFDFPPRKELKDGIAFEAVLDWALATADGRAPRDWRAPPADEALAAAGTLLARAGTLTAHGEVRRARNRLSVVFPEVTRIPEGLDEGRREWIAALAEDAQRRWRLVRLGPDASGNLIRGEVDLTGAPLESVGAFLALGTASLHMVIEWALPSLRLAANPKITSALLSSHPDSFPNRAGDARGKD